MRVKDHVKHSGEDVLSSAESADRAGVSLGDGEIEEQKGGQGEETTKEALDDVDVGEFNPCLSPDTNDDEVDIHPEIAH